MNLDDANMVDAIFIANPDAFPKLSANDGTKTKKIASAIVATIIVKM